ncbi:hypothetical protein BV898_08385 [Hypsibius exemplaris]|uniref:Cullin family profile domain-containing protein n=1 Tax=Hypsibius exemplaris TaxID=2072580 RepID=A0A1W0WQG9_HYPEX|nr:hypothetical protein BV898_08385 [Hypsibius exemplaris]
MALRFHTGSETYTDARCGRSKRRILSSRKRRLRILLKTILLKSCLHCVFSPAGSLDGRNFWSSLPERSFPIKQQTDQWDLLKLETRYETFSVRSFGQDATFTADLFSRLLSFHPRSSEFLVWLLDQPIRAALADSLRCEKRLTAPQELIKLLPEQAKFETSCVGFFCVATNGKKLDLISTYRSVILPGQNGRADAGDGSSSSNVNMFSYYFHVSPFQACILVLFNDRAKWILSDSVRATGLPKQELTRSIGALAAEKHRLLTVRSNPSGNADPLMEADTVLVVNDAFRSAVTCDADEDRSATW